MPSANLPRTRRTTAATTLGLILVVSTGVATEERALAVQDDERTKWQNIEHEDVESRLGVTPSGDVVTYQRVGRNPRNNNPASPANSDNLYLEANASPDDGVRLTWSVPAGAREFTVRAFATSRTQQSVHVYWEDESVDHYSGVYPTNKYSSSGELLETRIADSSGLQVNNIVVGQDPLHGGIVTANFELSSASSIPFCSWPGTFNQIQYDVDVTLYRPGGYIIVGDRRPVPNHEVFIRYDNNWSTGEWVFQGYNEGFHCLTSFCGRTAVFAAADLPPFGGDPQPV